MSVGFEKVEPARMPGWVLRRVAPPGETRLAVTKTIRLFFELRAGGYNGSTYTLTYDPAADVLKGIYYQAVAQQKFDVFFTRVK